MGQGGDVEVSEIQARLSGYLLISLFLLPANSNIELSAASLAPGLVAWYHGSNHDNNGLSL